MSRVILVGCVQKKQAVPAIAEELYVSPLFEKRREYAKREVGVGRAQAWCILSALHHCVAPDRLLQPYDWKMSNWRVTELGFWGSQVPISLRRDVLNCQLDLHGLVVEMHAGAEYVAASKPYLEKEGCIITQPLKHLGIGEQLHWYKQELEPYPQLEIT